MVSNNPQVMSFGAEGPKVCQENILHTIKPTPAAPAVLFIQGKMNPCFHVVHAKFCPNPLFRLLPRLVPVYQYVICSLFLSLPELYVFFPLFHYLC